MREHERVDIQYFLYLSSFNASRALYISTYSLFLTQILKLPLDWVPWLLVINLIATLAAEIPTGAIGDLVGRRNSFLVACGVSSIAYFVYGFLAIHIKAQSEALTFLIALLAEIFLGIGFTFYSGSLEAWAVDMKDDLNSKDLQLLFSRGEYYKNVIYSLAGIIGVVIHFILNEESLNVFLSASFITSLLLIYAYQKMASDPSRMKVDIRNNALKLIKEKIKSSLFFVISKPDVTYLIAASSISFLLLQTIVFFWPYYFVSIVSPITSLYGTMGTALLLGVSWGLSYAGRAVGNNLAKGMNKRKDQQRFLSVSVFVGSLSVILLSSIPLLTNLHAFTILVSSILFYTFTRCAEGMGDPIRMNMLNSKIKSDNRATLLSISSAANMIISSVGLVFVSLFLHLGAGLGQILCVIALCNLLTLPLYSKAFVSN